MAIVVEFDELRKAKKLTMTQLAEIIGITQANLFVLKSGKARAIRFSTLESLCKALDCQPGDVLRFVD